MIMFKIQSSKFRVQSSDFRGVSCRVALCMSYESMMDHLARAQDKLFSLGGKARGKKLQ